MTLLGSTASKAIAASVAALVATFATAPLAAQADRLDLGLRLRAFERAYEAQSDAKLRARAAKPLNDAVQAFFGMRLAEAARGIDAARRIVEGAEDSLARRAADAVRVLPERLVLAAGAKSLPLRIDRTYSAPDGENAPLPELEVALHDASGGEVGAFTGPLPESPFALPLRPLVDGDHRLTIRISVRRGDAALVAQSHTLHVAAIADGDDRLDALETALDELPAGTKTTTTETIRGGLRLLRSLHDGRTTETTYPAAAMLRATERWMASARAGEDGIRGLTGEHWLHVVAGRQTVPVRIHVPVDLPKDLRVPLVVAMHGAGGSENLFFDGYGDGKVVRLARERGFVVVAPRSGFLGGPPLPALVDELARSLPIDPARVVVVGHSMGAGQAIAATAKDPQRYVAVAALGGGTALRANDALRSVAFFVGVGTEDFALAGARALAKSVERLEPRLARSREYVGVEHLAIVQHALDDVFAFFDEALKSR